MLSKNDSKLKVPEHVVIIPDGNRRWARLRGLKPWQGHEAGAEKIEELIRTAFDLGVKNFSFWGSSVDNLKKRPLLEKKALLDIYQKYFSRLLENKDIHKHQARVNIIGRWQEQFPQKLKTLLKKIMEKTAHYRNYNLNFFLAYNGDDEMVGAVRRIVEKYSNNKKITASVIKENLLTRDLPPVDFLVRTGGEPHFSAGFMMWDVANAQLYFTKKFFPDFGKNDFKKALKEFSNRERRLGK